MVMKQIRYIKNHQNLDKIFAALADPTRRAILMHLMNKEASVNEIAQPFNISQPAISKHLKVLENAGLIERSVHKQRRPAKLNISSINIAVQWLEEFTQFWSASCDQLDDLLQDLQTAKSKGGNNA